MSRLKIPSQPTLTTNRPTLGLPFVGVPPRRPREGWRRACIFGALFFGFIVGAAASAQPATLDFGPDVSRNPPAVSPSTGSPYGRRVVDIRYKPASLSPRDFPLKIGDTLSPENLSAAMNRLSSHLTRHSEMIAELSGGSALIFTYVDAVFDLQPRGQTGNDSIGVTLRPFHLSLPLDEIGGRVLPIPRGLSAKAASIDARSPFLPTNLAFTNDRVLGTAIGGRWQFDFDPKHEADADRRLLRLRAGGLKSIDSAFYNADADLRSAWNVSAGLLRQLSFGAEGNASLEPRGLARYRTRAWGAAGGLALSLNARSRLLLDARFGRADHKFTATTPVPRWATSNEQLNRALFETIPPGLLGFFRASIWQENLNPRGGAASHRLAARAGYAKEIPVGVNQSIGFELIGGAGQTWGNIEAPRRYFAGGGQGEFMYEAAQSRTLAIMPDGPLLRSLGKAQGGVRSVASTRGGTHFWHLNLNVALPIPTWSRPLIPNEATDLPGPDGSPQTLKQILRSQIDRTGPNMLQSTLQTKDGLAPDQAKRRATEIFDGIRPAAHFVIDQANVFAIKPLLLLDIAELNASPGHERWTAAGIGLQLTIVTAKFEGGYMRTLSGPTFGSRGNFFGRLGFERLF